ncbi:uncharacterized protein F4807DRAFT_449051 [Annulohypoxylon truncatum]|uniref:uncharacterized protein n=1 Tax=Annulohypoxylon truncatum TaxID=327061 RepID=UPI002008D4F2|nr:uncharacterized protein F4807DRAFT_449051 [Annulohypoxylon truncatum]KAI1204066.1 hypothetical protein F4807DRAFT_449051 [Annulohypoxylon truncatum]
MFNEELKPFLNGQDDNELTRDTLPASPRQKNRFMLISLAVNVMLFFVCTTLSVATFLLSNSNTASTTTQELNKDWHTEPYSPANSAIEYEYRYMINNDTRFTGYPRLEWEHSMNELMEGTLIRISNEELSLYGNDSIPLKDGGYAAGLAVGHNLHCVKKLKKFLYREHFYPNLDSNEVDFSYIQSHADHCLDFLRQSILCHLDYSLYTLYWGERQQDIPTHHDPGIQKCVNWDKLHGWMIERSVSTDMLVRP